MKPEGNDARSFFGGKQLIRRMPHAFEQQFDSSTFFRVNRQQIVNLNRVEAMDLGVATAQP